MPTTNEPTRQTQTNDNAGKQNTANETPIVGWTPGRRRRPIGVTGAVWDVGDFLVTLSVAPGGPVESRHRHQLGSALLDAPKRIGQLFRVAAAAAAATARQ